MDQLHQTNNPSIIGEALLGAIRQAVREEIGAGVSPQHETGEERLLDAKEAAVMLSVSEDWLSRHAKKLPFTRKIGPKMLRFSYQGIVKWMDTRKLS
jgi:predicted DNA-binding transcriptional regulator AlpA